MLSAIIVNFRSSDLVNDCLRSLLAGNRQPDQVVVVDNEGSDGSLAPEFENDPRVLLRVVDSNPGYAASCNLGASLADGDDLLFLNADVTVESDTVERCEDVLHDDASIGIVTPRLVRLDGSLDHACHRGLPTPLASIAYKLRLHRLYPRSHRLARYTMAWLDPLTDHDVEACSGAFMLIGRDRLDAAGGWDERYRFYAEDLDLCLRVREAGGRVRYLGTVTAVHLKSAFSHNDVPDAALDDSQRQVKRWAQRQIIASHRLFFDEHIRSGSALPMRVIIELMFSLQSARLDVVERLART